MTLTGVLREGRLVFSILVAALAGCASPTYPNRERAALTARSPAEPSGSSAPRFAADGPNADKYGASEGYPVKAIFRTPFFVGMFSHYDQIFEGRTIRRAVTPSRFSRAPAEPALRYEYQTETFTLDDYLARNPTTGLLVARGDTILVERYQYARTDRHRFASFSMAKTVTAMLIGIAIAENLIDSVDDLAAAYVPALADTEYGRTPLRHPAANVLWRPLHRELWRSRRHREARPRHIRPDRCWWGGGREAVQRTGRPEWHEILLRVGRDPGVGPGPSSRDRASGRRLPAGENLGAHGGRGRCDLAHRPLRTGGDLLLPQRGAA
jgi:hypothetical protein